MQRKKRWAGDVQLLVENTCTVRGTRCDKMRDTRLGDFVDGKERKRERCCAKKLRTNDLTPIIDLSRFCVVGAVYHGVVCFAVVPRAGCYWGTGDSDGMEAKC